MLKRIGITLGLCGLTVMGGVGLSMAQSALSDGFGVDETLSFATDEAEAPAPLIAGVQYVAFVPQDAPLADIFADTPLAPERVSLKVHAEVGTRPARVRPVARPELSATPEADLVRVSRPVQPVFNAPVLRPTYRPGQSVNPQRYEPSQLASSNKLKSRTLIGVFR